MTEEEYISINDLCDIGTLQTTDDFLVSRKEDNYIISYKKNAYSLEQEISDDVQKYLKSSIIDPFTKKINERVLYIDSCHSDIEKLSNRLTTEWRYVSSDFISLKNSLSNLHDKISDDYQRLSNEINLSAISAIDWLKNYTTAWLDQQRLISDDILNEIKGWVNSNFVTLSTAQTITGYKTFTENINGIALSARWI